MCAHINRCTHTYFHLCTLIHAHTSTNTCQTSSTYTHIYAHLNAHPNRHTNVYSYVRTFIYVHASYTHMHYYTHIYPGINTFFSLTQNGMHPELTKTIQSLREIVVIRNLSLSLNAYETLASHLCSKGSCWQTSDLDTQGQSCWNQSAVALCSLQKLIERACRRVPREHGGQEHSPSHPLWRWSCCSEILSWYREERKKGDQARVMPGRQHTEQWQHVLSPRHQELTPATQAPLNPPKSASQQNCIQQAQSQDLVWPRFGMLGFISYQTHMLCWVF